MIAENVRLVEKAASWAEQKAIAVSLTLLRATVAQLKALLVRCQQSSNLALRWRADPKIPTGITLTTVTKDQQDVYPFVDDRSFSKKDRCPTHFSKVGA